MKHIINDQKKNNNKDNNNSYVAKPYMGNLTSAQIGNMAKAGALGGEMVRRMVKDQELQMANGKNDPNTFK